LAVFVFAGRVCGVGVGVGARIVMMNISRIDSGLVDGGWGLALGICARGITFSEPCTRVLHNIHVCGRHSLGRCLVGWIRACVGRRAFGVFNCGCALCVGGIALGHCELFLI